MKEQEHYQELVELYEEMEDYRSYRYRMLLYTAYYLAGIALVAGLMRLARVTAGMTLALLLAVVVIGGVVGLFLLSRFIQNEVRGRVLQAEIGAFKEAHDIPEQRGGRRKRKRKPKPEPSETDYTIGPDGELVEVDSDAAHDTDEAASVNGHVSSEERSAHR
jgi:hypothetical protein